MCARVNCSHSECLLSLCPTRCELTLMGEEQAIAVLQVSKLQTNDTGGHGPDNTIGHVLLVIHADEKIHIIRMSTRNEHRQSVHYAGQRHLRIDRAHLRHGVGIHCVGEVFEAFGAWKAAHRAIGIVAR